MAQGRPRSVFERGFFRPVSAIADFSGQKRGAHWGALVFLLSGLCRKGFDHSIVASAALNVALGRMAADVDRALTEIVAAQGSMDAQAARAYVAGLTKSGRYQRDVY